jgi:hypothetical protein
LLLGFRPECLSLADRDGLSEINLLRATLQTSTFLGDQFVFTARVNDRPLLGKSRTAPVEHNGVVLLRIEPHDIMLFPPRDDLSRLMT